MVTPVTDLPARASRRLRAEGLYAWLDEDHLRKETVLATGIAERLAGAQAVVVQWPPVQRPGRPRCAPNCPYMGNLTRPACTEDVPQMVMCQAMPMSSEEIEVFTQPYPMNARPVQQVASRMIKRST